MDAAAVVDSVQPYKAVRAARSRFYLAMALFMTGIVIAGFWPSYYGPLLRGSLDRHWVIHIHGAVFTGWMALLLAQVILVARGRIRLHRMVGRAGIAYGAVVVIVGLAVSVHKRLMVLATIALLFAAVGRLPLGGSLIVFPPQRACDPSFVPGLRCARITAHQVENHRSENAQSADPARRRCHVRVAARDRAAPGGGG